MIRLLTIAGTRPEAIKLAPIALAAARGPSIEHRLVASGQHDTLFDQVVAAFGLAIDRNLRLGRRGQGIDELARSVADSVAALCEVLRPHMLLVQGDTTTAWAAALGAARAGVAIGHVEAGLRSHDLALPWPEERNRVEIDALSTLLFAPTDDALTNLRREPAVAGQCLVTGNSGIDALLAMRARIGGQDVEPDAGRRRILVTCHRRENIGQPIARIGAALRILGGRGDVRVRVALHPNPAVRGGMVEALTGAAGVELLEPLAYPAMVAEMTRAHLIVSDSGGLQEEAPALGVPLLVLRDNSERPEVIASGNARLVGSDTQAIVAEAARLLDDAEAHAAMARPAFPYGDGRAAEHILDAIEAYFS